MKIQKYGGAIYLLPGECSFAPVLYMKCYDEDQTARKLAVKDFKEKRRNGSISDLLKGSIAMDGRYKWIRGGEKAELFCGRRFVGEHETECRYYAGLKDLEWFVEKDKYYLSRIQKEGNLRKLEPAVWYLFGRYELDGGLSDIGDWWQEFLESYDYFKPETGTDEIEAALAEAERTEKALGGKPFPKIRGKKRAEEEEKKLEEARLARQRAQQEHQLKSEQEKLAQLKIELKQKEAKLRQREEEQKKEKEALQRKIQAEKMAAQKRQEEIEQEKRKLADEKTGKTDKKGEKQLPTSLYIEYKELECKFSDREKIGGGSFGMVYWGKWQYIPVAIKVLHVPDMSQTTLDDFEKEAAIMKDLRHDYVVQLYGICTPPKSPTYCLVMQYMSNKSLYNVLHSGKPLDWTVRYSIALKMAQGLAFLHSKKIIHRDIKSLNVLIDEHMNPKWTDFGLAKVRTETRTKTKMTSSGTIQWMAPECFDPLEPEFSKASDMYACGMVFWEILTRKTPYEKAIDLMLVASAVQQGKREKIRAEEKAQHPRFTKLIGTLWKHEPENRPTAQQAISELEKARTEWEQQKLASYQLYSR